MAENLLIIHGGGPTAVINSSLYGAVREAKRRLKGGSVYAAIGGTGGLLRRQVKDLGTEPEERLSLLPPSAPPATVWRRRITPPWPRSSGSWGSPRW